MTKTKAQPPKEPIASPYDLHLDLDGVFANFELGVKKITGKEPWQLTTSKMWAAIHSNKHFFAELEFMPDAEELWDTVKHLNLCFLTGAPSSAAFREQKREWVARKFGEQYVTIVLPKKEKRLYAATGKVLLDDTHSNIEGWIEAGGHGIHHSSVRKSIEELNKHFNL